MFKVEFISEAGTQLICDSTRSLAEHNIRLNHQRLVQVEDLFGAQYKKGFARLNQRNRLSFDVWRSKDAAGAEFADPEAALLFALDAADIGSAGLIKVTLAGAATGAVRYMHDALLESSDLSDATLGLDIGLSYVFSGGLIDNKPN